MTVTKADIEAARQVAEWMLTNGAAKKGAVEFLVSAFRAHRLAHATPPPEAEGYKLVPVVPTEEMLNKGYDRAFGTFCNLPAIRAVYAAMLSAAPLPASPNPPPKEQDE